jgi:putative transposase
MTASGETTRSNVLTIALVAIVPARALGGLDAYVESFHRRFRDECLNEHWFTTLAHAQAIIEAWRRKYNQERPKKGLCGLAPGHYARQLAEQRGTVTVGL